MTKERFWTAVRRERTILKWMKRENYDAAVHGYTFLLLTPFSFGKLLKNDWWVVTVLKNIESTPGKAFLKSTTPANYTLKGVDRPRTLKTAPRSLMGVAHD